MFKLIGDNTKNSKMFEKHGGGGTQHIPIKVICSDVQTRVEAELGNTSPIYAL